MNVQRGGWSSFASKDSGILHATLCSVALYCSVHQGLDSGVDIFRHKAEALALVKQKLVDPEMRLSDALIGTIATLASFEVSFHYVEATSADKLEQNLQGSYETSASHLDGIHRLLAMRGGIQAIQGNDMLYRAITWSVVFVSCLETD
jgi:hypothetical protein